MNKKLLVGVLAAGLLMTGCASSKPIAFTTGQTVHVAGPTEVKVNGEWVANEWAATDNNKLAPASLADIQKLDKGAYEVLKERDIKALYTISFRIGENADTNNKEKALVNGELKEFDQKYAVKAIVATYEETDEVYNADYWCPSPESGKAESLTPATLFVTPNHSDKDDENGFNHNSNPVCISGAGEYTLIFAQYATVLEDSTVLGLGLVKAK